MRSLDEIELYLLTCAQLMGAKASDGGDRARLVREKNLGHSRELFSSMVLPVLPA